MELHIHKKSDSKYPGSLGSVIHDWDVLGIFCVFHLYEWEQKDADKNKSLTSADGLLLAFIFPYLTFMSVDRHRISQSWSSELHEASVELSQFQ